MTFLFRILIPCLLLLCLCAGCQEDKADKLSQLQKEAHDLMDQRRWRAALACYIKALSIEPDSAPIHYQIGMIDHRLGNMDLAIKHLEKAATLSPDYTDALLELGYCYLVTNRYKNAEAMARAILKADPENIQARLLIGDRSAFAGRYVRALSLIKTLLKKHPDNIDLWLRLGDLNLLLDRRKEAKDAYSHCISLAPERPIVWLSWVNFCRITGELTEAEKALQELCKLEPHNLTYVCFLGDFYLETGRKEKGLAIYHKAIKEIPGADTHAPFIARLIEVLLFAGKKEEAGTWLSKLADLDLRGVQFYYLKGHLYLEQGSFTEAIEAFQQAIHLTEPCDTLYFYLGLAQWLNGYTRQAKASWNEALRLNPAHVQTLLHLAALYTLTGDSFNAQGLLRQVISISPNAIDAHVLLALNLLGQKQWDNFTQELRLLARLHAGDKKLKILEIIKCLEKNSKEVPCELLRKKDLLAATSGDPPALHALLSSLRGNSKQIDIDPIQMALSLDNRSPGPKALSSKLAAEDITIQESPDWLYLRARYALASGNMKLAKKIIGRLRGQKPHDVAVHRLAVATLDKVPDKDERISAYRSLLSLSPNDPYALNNLAWLLSQRDDMASLKEAQSLAEKACAKNSEDPAFQDTRGWIYWKQGMKESAKQAWETAISLAPDNQTIKSHLALLEGK